MRANVFRLQLIRSISLLAVCTTLTISVAVAAGKRELPTSSAEKVGMSSERLNRLNSGMQAIVDQGKLAGVVTMVSRHGKIVNYNAVGKRDVAANAPMKKDDIFRIYSMSKPITGVAMMMLFEEGKW